MFFFSRLNPIVVMAVIAGVILASAFRVGDVCSSPPSGRCCCTPGRSCFAICEVACHPAAD